MYSNRKFENAITSAVAIAQAASMTTGIRVQISVRGTSSILVRSNRNHTYRCTTIIAYDSKTDKMSKIRNLFEYLTTFGMTPEGVAFKSIEKQIIQDSNGCECIFINYSDGYPTHMGHYGSTPVDYTRLSYETIQRTRYKYLVIFYNNSGGVNLTKFKEMYGKDAEHIDPQNMLQVSRTINSKFLEKSK